MHNTYIHAYMHSLTYCIRRHSWNGDSVPTFQVRWSLLRLSPLVKWSTLAVAPLPLVMPLRIAPTRSSSMIPRATSGALLVVVLWLHFPGSLLSFYCRIKCKRSTLEIISTCPGLIYLKYWSHFRWDVILYTWPLQEMEGSKAAPWLWDGFLVSGGQKLVSSTFHFEILRSLYMFCRFGHTPTSMKRVLPLQLYSRRTNNYYAESAVDIHAASYI